MDVPAFVMNIIKNFHDKGFNAYIVGGAIRDMILNRPITDWDVATSASPEEIRTIFQDVRNFALKHETVTLVHSGHLYEITTIRGSGNSPHSIEDDLGHRDFTINAMAYDVTNNVVLDPSGGKGDIAGKTIRAAGEPSERFNEDPLRLLRAVRFAVELGFKIDDRTMETIQDMSARLALAAQERIRDEFIKILMTRRPSYGFILLRRSGLMEQILPEILEGYLKRQNSHHRYTIYRHIMETIDLVEQNPVLRLVALLHDIAKPRVRQKIKGKFRFFRHAEESAKLAGEIMERLRFNGDLIKMVKNLILYHMIDYHSKWGDGAVRRLVRRVGSDNMEHLISFRRSDLLAHGYRNGKLRLLSELEGRVKRIKDEFIANHIGDLAVDGKKVMDILGISPGPAVGRALNILLEDVTDHPEINTEEGLTDLLRDMKKKEIIDGYK